MTVSLGPPVGGSLGDGVDGLLLRAIQSPYCRSQSLVHTSTSDPFPVRVGPCQSCPLSLVLLIIVMETISKRRQAAEGVKFGGVQMAFLLFADDVVLLTASLPHRNSDLSRV